jgi:cyclohexanone monooxygenase
MTNRIDIDIEALEQRYAEEREKRIRADATSQYRQLKDFAGLAADPHADPDFTREARTEDVDVVIIGGGLAGLLAGGRLREHDIESIRIIEKGADFGGTWYWNRYPGAACDVESYIYMPMLEEMGYIPTERYARAPEIFEYCKKLAARYDLYPAALFQTEATRIAWDEARSRWLVSTDRGDAIAARFVVSCGGLLANAKLPAIPGIERFQGHAFHTTRWDYGYTGGDSYGNLTGLKDKVVGIIGTGSTGIQAIPVLAQWARRLYVFQRTPSSVDVRDNRPTDPEWARGLKPGWQPERIANFTALTNGQPVREDLIQDGWTSLARSIFPEPGATEVDPQQLRAAEMRKMEEARQRVADIVKDPATAEALKPYYHYLCKRPCFHDEYLPAFNRPNVTLVDTKGRGVERIAPGGPVVDGREYPVDCLIYATGFDWLVDYGRHTGLEVIGPGGRSLSQHWSHGVRSLYGMQTHGFPNFFLVSLIQAGVSFNYVHTADEQVQHIRHVIRTCLERGVTSVQPTEEAQNAWIDEVIASAGPRRAFLESCTPGYYNFEGRRDETAELNDFFGGPASEYYGRLRALRAGGGLPGMACESAEVEP